MKNILIAAMFLMISATSFAQLNETHQRSQVFQSVPVYGTGGFHPMVWNSTTGRVEYTNYTIDQDTVNGNFTFLANGTSNNGWQVTTPTTYKQLVTASRSGISGNVHLKDTSGSKYLDFNSHDGITAFDTIWNNTKVFRIETIPGTKSITVDSTKLRVDCGKITMGSGSVAWTIGTGTPLYIISAPVGSMFTRTNGGLDSTLYIKMVGTDSAGWYPAKH